MTDALVIGAGPAGLMAADILSAAGHAVTLADAMPSVGRKFLMAGKSGLNLTKIEAADAFLAVYAPLPAPLHRALAGFGPDQVVRWAETLGQPVFTGSTGRVFPTTMKASPLLRAWLARLGSAGVMLHTRWRWTGWNGAAVQFATPDGPVTVTPKVTVLALGGASWARLGADGKWAALLPEIAPFQPANMGFLRDWSPHMTPFFGQPIKGIALKAGDVQSRGEMTISAAGLEGGGIYEVSRAMRDGAGLLIDLLPDIPPEVVAARWSAKASKATVSQFLKSGLRLSPAKIALFHEVTKAMPPLRPDHLAGLIKALPIDHSGSRPMDEAISTAGGLRFAALTDDLMLHDRPGVFCAGEMLDWEAPTGGYLITACLATGRLAGQGAVAHLARLAS